MVKINRMSKISTTSTDGVTFMTLVKSWSYREFEKLGLGAFGY